MSENKIKTDTNRIYWVDLLKGLAMISMVFAHVISDEVPGGQCLIKSFIYSFHMPLLFFLSGYVFSPDKYPRFKDLLMSKIKSIILPMVIFTIANELVNIVYYGILLQDINISIGKICNDFIGLLLQYRIGKYAGMFWFLPCLFIAEVLLYWYVKIYNYSIYIYLITLIATYSVGGILVKNGILLPYTIEMSMIAVIFVGIGYFLKMKDYILQKLSIYTSIIFFTVNVVLTYCNYAVAGRVDMCDGNLGSLVLYVIAAQSAICGWIIVAQKSKELKVLQYIGKNSLLFYLLGKIGIIFQNIIIYNILHTNIITIGNLGLIVGVVCTFIYFVCLYPFTLVINNKMPFLIGKFKKVI